MIQLAIAGTPENTLNYRNAFSRLGAGIHIMPSQEDAWKCDALILPGGGDISPRLYGQPNLGSRGIDEELDRRQYALADLFIRAGKPVLGICKGMQLLNTYFGGGIMQDMADSSAHRYDGKDQVHNTFCTPGCLLEQLYTQEFPVNSAHHQCILRPGFRLSIVQRSFDHVPEGILHSSLPVIGVQWHPERMCFENRRDDTPDGSILLQYFLTLAG